MSSQKLKKIIVRFPPSPTGPLHIGNVRTALFNYFFVRQNMGEFILRVEDTDKTRSKKEYEDDMIANLKWLGIKHDNSKLLHQSERSEIYNKYLHKLIKDGKAYVSIETEGENREVVRFKNPNITVTFTDLVRGTVSINTTDLGDFIIARNIDNPVYHLAVVVDDFEQGITHVIRGEDHISNTPRQILIQEAIGAPRPIYVHLPLILATDRSKLSKRKHGEMVSLDYYKRQGYLPETLTNFLGLLGFNPGGDQEIFSLEEFIKIFDFDKVQNGGAIFNLEKLNWFNKYYIHKLSHEQKIIYLGQFLSEDKMKLISKHPQYVEILLERVSTFGELRDQITSGEFDYFFDKPIYEKEKLSWKGKGSTQEIKRRLTEVSNIINKINPKSFNKENIKNAIWDFAEKEGRGDVLWPLRMCLSGKEKSPDPFTLIELLGKTETLSRVEKAIHLLS